MHSSHHTCWVGLPAEDWCNQSLHASLVFASGHLRYSTFLCRSHTLLSIFSVVYLSGFNLPSMNTLMTINRARWRAVSSISGVSVCFSSISSSSFWHAAYPSVHNHTTTHMRPYTEDLWTRVSTPIAPILSHPGVSGEWRCSFIGWHTPLHIWNAQQQNLPVTLASRITSGYLVLSWCITAECAAHTYVLKFRYKTSLCMESYN